MIQCEKCRRVIGAIHESEEIDVTGEVLLVFMCPDLKCNHVTNYMLYEYGTKRKENKRKIRDRNKKLK
jgi:hypothetical protein